MGRSFFDILRKRAEIAGQEEQGPMGLTKLTTNNFPHYDFIVKDGETISIYSPDVSFVDIVSFFKERIPWAGFELGEDLLNLEDQSKINNQKNIIYNTLIGLLENISIQFNGDCSGASKDYGPHLLKKPPEWKKDGRTLN